jgi:hypothetical protein
VVYFLGVIINCMEVGPSDIVEILGKLSTQSRLPVKSLGVLDADKPIKTGCILLPGTEAPEKQVFRDIRSTAVHELAQRLALSDESISDALEKAQSLPNHHNWLEFLARKINQSEAFLWTTMSQIWVKHCICHSDVQDLIEKINTYL